jgi:capsular exopolysaccharide synthesis family protein
MNKVFKALQQAQRDRVLAERPREDHAPVVADVRPVRIAAVGTPPPPPVPRVSDERPTAGTESVDSHLVSLLDPVSVAGEQYRTLRYLVELAHRDEQVNVLAISAPSSGEGKTTTSINLAGALAQAPGRRVLLVDGDLRRPAMVGRLGLPDHDRGLVDAILDPTLALADVVQSLPRFNLFVVPAGPQSSSPYELLQSPRLAQLLAEARAQYDYVVIDTPPLLPVPDCRIIGKHVDGFLLVVTAHKTRTGSFKEAVSILRSSKVLGVVFNATDDAEVHDYYAAGYYTSPDTRKGRQRWHGAAARLGRLGLGWTKSSTRNES